MRREEYGNKDTHYGLVIYCLIKTRKICLISRKMFIFVMSL